jgi:prevent-host-death family protein
MIEVGVRELKAKLSHYLDRAANGEVIRVTDHGKPKATLGPATETAIERGIREGWIRPGSGKPLTIPKVRFKGRGPLTTTEIIRQDRDAE